MRSKSQIIGYRGPSPRPSPRGRGGAGAPWAFTLIELLAVIAIIGLLAGLALGVGGVAVSKNREGRIKAEHARLVTAIESYKAEVGTYPPDNNDYTGFPNHYERSAKNSLFYELSGAIFTNNTFVPQNRIEPISTASLKSNFGVDGVQNSARRKVEVPFRGITFKPNQFAAMRAKDGVTNAFVLVVPLRGPAHAEIDPAVGTMKLNTWLYDASSTNRHNPETYDLWTEYLGKNRTNVVGNWKE